MCTVYRKGVVLLRFIHHCPFGKVEVCKVQGLGVERRLPAATLESSGPAGGRNIGILHSSANARKKRASKDVSENGSAYVVCWAPKAGELNELAGTQMFRGLVSLDHAKPSTPPSPHSPLPCGVTNARLLHSEADAAIQHVGFLQKPHSAGLACIFIYPTPPAADRLRVILPFFIDRTSWLYLQLVSDLSACQTSHLPIYVSIIIYLPTDSPRLVHESFKLIAAKQESKFLGMS